MTTTTYHDPEEVAELFGVNAETLRNWRRLESDHPRHLGAQLVDGKYQYTPDAIIEWLGRPANATFKEYILGSFAPDHIRKLFDDFNNTHASSNIH